MYFVLEVVKEKYELWKGASELCGKQFERPDGKTHSGDWWMHNKCWGQRNDVAREL